jgi:DNA-directed RNA polymerase specialized sigma subunit
MPLKNKESRKLYNHNYYKQNKEKIIARRKQRPIEVRENYFDQYRGMIEGSAWAAAKLFHLDIYDLRSQAYLIFCEALESYDSSKASFSTYLYNRLLTINDYCKLRQNKKYSSIYDKTFCDPGDTKYSNFVTALENLESKLELSKDAMNILNFITRREWENVEAERKNVPRYSIIKNVYKEKNWKPARTQKAWAEIQYWWKENKYSMEA